MYCLVDFRNCPQLQYTFTSREKARERLQRLKNNALGVTVFYPDGRREYFERGLPQEPWQIRKRAGRIQRGCHVKYKIQKFGILDGLRKTGSRSQNGSFGNWKTKSAFSLFMLGNRKIYTGLAVVSLAILSSTLYFQNYYSQSLSAKSAPEGQVAGAADEKNFESENSTETLKLANEDVIMNLLGKIEEEKQEEFEKEILRYIKGRPMEAMAPFIARQDRIVAAFIVGIAMKESKFGVYSPKKGSQDCYNYWGYKGRENTTVSGYSCFNSPEHAIQVVGKKIDSLTARGISNPAEMISWKCGSTCAGHGAEDVRKWIADVGVNFYKINSEDNS